MHALRDSPEIHQTMVKLSREKMGLDTYELFIFHMHILVAL
jgi:hypothetical protein